MYRHFFKRIIDFCVALVALVCISPVLIVVAIWLHFANRKEPTPGPSLKEPTPGPSLKGRVTDTCEVSRPWWGNAFFLQERPGWHGKIFKIIKFKTMTDERDAEGNLLPDADRLTKVGRFVRSTSIDELPQLINVLKGDMSLIGPRPLRDFYLPLYSKEQMRRHEVRPGITGWAQCHGRNAITWTEKFKLDVWYVNNLSFLLDIKIIISTIQIVFSGKGVSQEGHATMEPFNGHN